MVVRSNIARWEKKYRSTNAAPFLISDPLLVDYAYLLKGEGLALDLAAGACHASVQLAKLGRQVIALDCSLTALQIGQRIATLESVCIQGLVADLDNWSFPSSAFEVITCLRYLNRTLFPAIKNSLKPGGLLLYKTFNQHHLREAPRFNPKYLLRPGELAQSFSDLELIVCSDGADSAEPYSFAIAKCSEKL
jgi:SAM-dependent methyltransferase